MPNAIVATITIPSRAGIGPGFRRAHRVHAGVIGERGDAVADEPIGGLVDLLPRQAIDDARVA